MNRLIPGWLWLSAFAAACQPHGARTSELEPKVVSSSTPPPASTASVAPSASSAPSAVPSTSRACAPPDFPRASPKTVTRSLEGLVDGLRSPGLTLRDVEQVFGKASTSHRASTSYDIPAPVPELARVTIGYRHVQNRRYLTYAELDFADSARPTVGVLAGRLGLQAQVGTRPVRDSCMDASCPSLRFEAKTEPKALSFYLTDAARSALGSRNVRDLVVQRVHFFLLDGNCTTGELRTDPVALPEAADTTQEAFETALVAAVKELRNDAYDAAKIKQLLAPFGEARAEHNDMSKFRWIRLMPERSAFIGPFCMSSFRYLREESLLCRVLNDETHLYEGEATATHRVFIKVQLGEGFGSPPDKVQFVEVTLMPKDWKDIVF